MKSLSILMLAACMAAAGAPVKAAGQTERTKKADETKAAVLDINRASAEDFAKLPGIGPELARRIVAYRKRHGPFHRTEDLIAIHGMGAKKWRAIRARLKVASQGGKREGKR